MWCFHTDKRKATEYALNSLGLVHGRSHNYIKASKQYKQSILRLQLKETKKQATYCRCDSRQWCIDAVQIVIILTIG